jgi:hypothetical protein
MSAPDARERLGALGGDAALGSAQEFSIRLRGEIAKWGRLIKALGLREDAAR